MRTLLGASLTDFQLHPSVTPEVIAEAAKAGITGVKLYPQGRLPLSLLSLTLTLCRSNDKL